MFPSKALLSLCLLATAAAASHMKRDNNASLSFATRFKQLDQGKTIADVDRERATALKAAGAKGKRDGTVSATNVQLIYTASVGVGSPATQYTLLVDTGSSNTWVGADKPYIPTFSSKKTGNNVTVTYGSGSSSSPAFSGEEYIDTVTLASGLVVKEQSIGVASSAQKFSAVYPGADGILGIGPVTLTQSTVSNTDSVPTVPDNLAKSSAISTESIGIYFAPAAGSNSGGELSFGGPDSSKTTGDIAYVPITSTAPASQYWGIDESIAYGNTTILDKTAGIVDTGTTLILIASDAFQKYQNAIGATSDTTTGLLKITSAQYDNLEDLNFMIGNTTYPLTANGQIFPRSLNSAIGGDANSIYLVVSDIGTPSGQGYDFVNGYAFLERYYSVFDTTNSQVGFAPTAYTNATSN